MPAPRSARGADRRERVDWAGLTKLTQADFADELATFYRCIRVQREDLVCARFLGAQLSPRFLKEGRLYPYEGPTGAATVAIGEPIDTEILRAVETALGQRVSVAVATADTIDAALASKIEI